MAKWVGQLGFSNTIKTRPGVYTPNIEERLYSGDMTSNRFRKSTTDKINNDVSLSAVITVVFDPYAIENYANIVYATHCGVKWAVEEIDITTFPHATITLGGIYNGE